jgi:hypothetical protein
MADPAETLELPVHFMLQLPRNYAEARRGLQSGTIMHISARISADRCLQTWPLSDYPARHNRTGEHTVREAAAFLLK